MTAVSRCISAYLLRRVILPGDTIEANQCLVLREIKGCQVRDGIVGKWGDRISCIL